MCKDNKTYVRHAHDITLWILQEIWAHNITGIIPINCIATSRIYILQHLWNQYNNTQVPTDS